MLLLPVDALLAQPISLTSIASLAGADLDFLVYLLCKVSRVQEGLQRIRAGVQELAQGWVGNAL